MKLSLLNSSKWCRSAFLAAGLCAFASQAWAEGAATKIDSDAIRQNLYSTCLANENVGWAVGDLGRIFHTRDGGRSWTLQSAGTKRPFVAVTCTDEKNVWIAGQSGQIARSTDGGNTWKTIDSGTTKQILSIQMVNSNVGIAVGDFGTILRTENGGESWTSIEPPSDIKLPEDMEGIVEPGDIVFYSVHFVDSEFVALAGEFGVVLLSQDGGKTFTYSATGVESTLFGVFFADRQRGWAVGMETEFVSTTDGGVTWKKEAVKTPPGFSLALFDLEVRGQVGWAVGNSGYLLSSSDAGSTWNLVTVPPQMGSYWFRDVALLANGKGLIVGSTGIVLTLEGQKYTAHRKQL